MLASGGILTLEAPPWPWFAKRPHALAQRNGEVAGGRGARAIGRVEERAEEPS
jgi:hypothetical protein